MDEPRATPMARSILSFMATKTAVMCSQALPAIGRIINPKKVSFSPELLLTASMAPVRNLHATKAAVMPKHNQQGVGNKRLHRADPHQVDCPASTTGLQAKDANKKGR